MPRTVTVDPVSPDPAIVRDAARVLREGGLVAFPTETVYGLGARGLEPSCVRRIFAAKGRPATHPLILHVTDLAMAAPLVRDVEAIARFAERFWPGPLTLIAPRSSLVPDEITGGGDTVAVRAPSHPVAIALLRALGEPIAAPSANRYQTLSPTLAAHVVKSLGDAVDLVVDGGACAEGVESTVLDLTAAPPRILRPGAVTPGRLREIEPLAEYTHTAVGDGPRASPGLDARHYAPRVPLRLAVTGAELVRGVDDAHARGAKVAIVARSVDLLRLAARLGARSPRLAPLPDDAASFAAVLYATLHALEDGSTEIHALLPPDTDAWTAVRDRLLRAATS